MKASIITLLGAALLALNAAACSSEHVESEHRNWDGSVTHDSTTVRHNDITGNTTVDKDSTRTR